MATSIDTRELRRDTELQPSQSILPSTSEIRGALKGFFYAAIGTAALIGASHFIGVDSDPASSQPRMEQPAPTVPVEAKDIVTRY